MKYKIKQKSENKFKYNFNTKHPNYVFESNGDKYHAVGITHEESTFGIHNMPLSHNPKSGDKTKAYIRNGYIVDKQRSFSKKDIKNLKFSTEDIPNVKSKVRHYKNLHKKSNKKPHKKSK